MTSNRANYCYKNWRSWNNPESIRCIKPKLVQTQVGSHPSFVQNQIQVEMNQNQLDKFKPKLVLTHKTPQQQPQLPQVLASSRASPVSSRGSQAKKHIFVVYDGQYMILNNIWLNIYIYFQSVMDMMKRFLYKEIHCSFHDKNPKMQRIHVNFQPAKAGF